MLNKRSDKALALTQKRQEAWVTALNRADFFPSHYKNAAVCDRHFVSGTLFCNFYEWNLITCCCLGKSAKYNDVGNVDWVPTLNLGYQFKKECDERPNEQLDVKDQIKNECDEEVEPNEQLDVNEELDVKAQFEVIFIEELNSKETQTMFINLTVGTQTDDRYTGVSPDIVASYKEKVAFLEEMLNSKNLKDPLYIDWCLSEL